MNKIAKEKCENILASFRSDSSGLLESRAVRSKERKDSHIFYFQDLYEVITPRVLQESQYYQTYENSFSKKRSLFDESGRGSLNRHPRTK